MLEGSARVKSAAIGAIVGPMTMLACIGAAPGAAAAEVRVFCTGAPSVAVKAVAENFAKETGHRFSFTIGQPATIQDLLATGDKADVVIVPAPVAAKLAASGTVRADTIVELAKVGVGVVVRAGAPLPDISNAAAIRKLIVAARSIVYPDPTSGGGSAGRAIAHMIDRMGLTAAVRPKLTRNSAIGGGVALVAAGKAEVGFFNISEIQPVPGVTLVGPLPAPLQSYIVFAASIPVSNTTPEPAAAFIAALTAPAAGEAWRKSGMEPAGH